MIINLKIPDSLYEAYLSKYAAPNHYKKMKDAIEALKDLDPSDRFFIVSGDSRRKIESILDHSIESAAQLATDIEKMNKFQVGDIGITFNAEELARIDTQATFHGKDRETYMLEMAQYIKDRMLENV